MSIPGPCTSLEFSRSVKGDAGSRTQQLSIEQRRHRQFFRVLYLGVDAAEIPNGQPNGQAVLISQLDPTCRRSDTPLGPFPSLSDYYGFGSVGHSFRLYPPTLPPLSDMGCV